MATDLNHDTQICTLPIIRDNDGLALSSRNTYLSPRERQAALVFPQSLKQAEDLIKSGITDTAQLVESIQKTISSQPLVQIDYVEIVSLDTLKPLAQIQPGNTLVAGAVKVGKTRLIDNFIIGEI